MVTKPESALELFSELRDSELLMDLARICEITCPPLSERAQREISYIIKISIPKKGAKSFIARLRRSTSRADPMIRPIYELPEHLKGSFLDRKYPEQNCTILI